MARTKVNDLEIIIKAKNEAQKAMGEVKEDIGDIDKLTVIASRSIAGLGAAGVAGFTALALNGEQVALQLSTMGTLLGTGTQEAAALYSVIREQNPKADIDALSDGVLTLTERFSEARVESGELFAFSEDFGFEFDANISGAREQTLEFLKAVRQLPDPVDRITTTIAVMGDEGARQFNKIVRNAAVLDDTIAGLETEVDGLFDAEAAQDIDDFTEATYRLENSFDDLSLTIFGIVDGPWAAFKNAAADSLDSANDAIKAYQKLQKEGVSDLVLATPGLAVPDLVAQFEADAKKEIQDQLRLLKEIEAATGVTGSDSGKTVEQQAREKLEAARARRDAEKASEKALKDAERAAEKIVKAELKIQRDAHAAIEKSEEELLEKLYQKRIDHENLIAETMAFRRQQGFVDIPSDADGNPENPDPFVTEGGFNQQPVAFNDGAIEDNENQLQKIIDKQKALQDVKDDTLLVAEAFGALEGAIAGFSDTFFSKGSRAFKTFIKLQQLAATASAYSAAAQALAGFDTFTAADKIVAGLKVLGIGLGWASQIASLDASAGSAVSAGSASASSTPNIPQAPDVPEQSNTGGTLNVTVASRTLNDLISVDVVQGIFDLAKEIPGGASDINFNQVLSG